MKSNSSNFIIVNNQLTRRSDIKFSLDDRAVRFSDGFFETMRSLGTKIFNFENHILRIKKAWKILNFDDNPPLEQILPALERLCKSNKSFLANRVRLTFYRSSGTYYLPENNSVNWYLEIFPLEHKFFELNKTGFEIDIYEEIPKIIHPFLTIKNNFVQFYTLATLWAKKNNLDDALLINEHSNIVEATSSNIFIVKNNQLITTPLSSGCVEGTCRQLILAIAQKNNYPFIEKNITKNDLLEADEIFLTNAIKGIQWVQSFKHRRYFNKWSKQLTADLNHYLEKLEEFI